MSKEQQFNQMIDGKEAHYSKKGFMSKCKKVGGKLGTKGLESAATLFVALKSPNMSRSNKLVIAGALGYFILPIDLVADLLPVVGLSDDLFVITMALSKVYLAITDDMKQEAHGLVTSKFGRFVHQDEQ